MREFYILLLIFFIPLLSCGQNNYFISDRTTSIGIELVDNGDLINSRQCVVKMGDKIIKYSPDEVDEYGFKNGRVYISKEIEVGDSSKRVFLHRLKSGKATLYFYREKGVETYFIQKDGTLFIEIPKKNKAGERFTVQLSRLTNDCSNVHDACNFVSYNKRSLAKLISRYNLCELKPFPHLRYGLLTGYELSTLIPAKVQAFDLENFDYFFDGSFSLGLFIDKPLFVSSVSFHSELIFSRNGFSIDESVENRDLDFVANYSSLKVPILIRYTYPSKKIRPFINIGAVGTYLTRNETFLYQATIVGSTINISIAETPKMLSDKQLGYVIGGGIEYNFNYKSSLFFELRYCNQYFPGKYEFHGISTYSLCTGLNFHL